MSVLDSPSVSTISYGDKRALCRSSSSSLGLWTRGCGWGLVRDGERGKGEEADVVEVVVVTEPVSHADSSSSSSSSVDHGEPKE